MIFTVCGGDLRSVYLVRRLLADGHEVRCFNLDTADIPAHCRRATLIDALTGTQCVILPTPATDGAVLRAPYGSQQITLEALALQLPTGIPVFAGAPGEALTALCRNRGIKLIDLLSVEALAVKNAALTAECAVQVIMETVPYSLAGCPVLILGAGRIGKLLGMKLRAMGADVTVSARRAEERAWCAALGLTPADAETLSPRLPQFQLLVNTIPAPVVTQQQLGLLRQDAVLFELASGKGGFPDSARLTHNFIHCGGLPGKYAPQSAADAIAETIYDSLER